MSEGVRTVIRLTVSRAPLLIGCKSSVYRPERIRRNRRWCDTCPQTCRPCSATSTRHDLLNRLRGEFTEEAGLRLTAEHVQTSRNQRTRGESKGDAQRSASASVYCRGLGGDISCARGMS